MDGPAGKGETKKGTDKAGLTSRLPGLFQSALYKTRLNVDIIIGNLHSIDSTKIMNFQAAGIVLDKLRFDRRKHAALRKE